MKSLRCFVLTVSDRSSSGERPDSSGPLLVEAIKQQGWQVDETAVVPDDIGAIEGILRKWSDDAHAEIIFTTGGTGFAPRDVTPEATLAVVERLAPGLAEAMRAQSLIVTPHAMLSRAVAGIRGHTIIINLPGSPKAALENLQTIMPVLPHAVELLRDAPSAEAGHTLK